jgi:hypothetical protein
VGQRASVFAMRWLVVRMHQYHLILEIGCRIWQSFV